MTLDEFLLWLSQLFTHSMHCAASPISTQGCANFWITCYLLVFFIVGTIFLRAVRHSLREKAEFKAYQQRKLERAKVADAETMKKVQWQANDEFEDIDHSELAEKMRHKMNKDKIE